MGNPETRELYKHRFANIRNSSRLKDLLRQLGKSKYLYMMFILPAIYYIVFQYVPMYGVLIAFKKYNYAKGIWGSQWVGLKYFSQFFTDPYSFILIKNTILLSFFTLLFSFPAPIILALLLNEIKNDKFKKFTQSVSYLPHFISTVVVCGMITNFCSYDGIINGVITKMGFEPVHFLMKPEWFRPIYIISGIWQGIGWGSIIYLAALTNIDIQQYEAAIIDGANRWKQTLYVTLPGIAPTIIIMLILQLGRIMSVGFEKILLLYNGSTYETADVIQTFVYRRGLDQSDFSYATAVGLFQSIINLVFILSANKISKKVSDNSLW